MLCTASTAREPASLRLPAADVLRLAPAFGGGFYDARTGQPTLNTPENLRALTFMVETAPAAGLENVLRFTSGLSATSGRRGPSSAAIRSSRTGEWRVEQCGSSRPDLEYRTRPAASRRRGAARRYAASPATNFMTIPRGRAGRWKAPGSSSGSGPA